MLTAEDMEPVFGRDEYPGAREIIARRAPTPCMGGFCHMRVGCPHYSTVDRREVQDRRLCRRGHDGEVLGRALGTGEP